MLLSNLLKLSQEFGKVLRNVTHNASVLYQPMEVARRNYEIEMVGPI